MWEQMEKMLICWHFGCVWIQRIAQSLMIPDSPCSVQRWKHSRQLKIMEQIHLHETHWVVKVQWFASVLTQIRESVWKWISTPPHNDASFLRHKVWQWWCVFSLTHTHTRARKRKLHVCSHSPLCIIKCLPTIKAASIISGIRLLKH